MKLMIFNEEKAKQKAAVEPPHRGALTFVVVFNVVLLACSRQNWKKPDLQNATGAEPAYSRLPSGKP